jgi:hypothetical protein
LNYIYDFLSSASKPAIFSRAVTPDDAACGESDLPEFGEREKRLSPPKT